MNFSIGSLFDGSGGFPLAGTLCGMEPRWASEVEPYPIAVTRSRFPDMKHLGDISKVNGAEIEPVDVITFGSPCQDLSVAGRQAGMKHQSNGDSTTTRSGLFMEAVRIIKEMRRATNDQYPKFAVWENVPGAFSSNKGEDFHTVLEEIIQIVEPTAPPLPSPEKGGWAYSDVLVGDGWSVAYRTFDAQYWGVPQRRRRIYLVADFTGGRARKILFERDGLRGYFAEGGTPWKEISAKIEGCAGATGRNEPLVIEPFCKGSRGRYKGDAETWKPAEVSNTLNTFDLGEARANELVIAVYDVSRAREALISPTLDTVDPNPNKNQGGLAIVQTENYTVRRLTPTEYARLQGFADWWGYIEPKDALTDSECRFWTDVRNTHAAINGRAVKDYTEEQMLAWYNKLHSDSAEYKMWGNGIALPTALYVMQGIADVLTERAA